MAAPGSERFTVRSSDGVEISVQKAGSGPALLLIHGAVLNGTLSWGAVLPRLAERFTVYAMDRRGRAPSGDAVAYSLDIEADDIVQVVRAIGSPLQVLGHSYGALASMAAENRFAGVERLILYEPPLRLDPLGPRGEEVVARMQAALDAGDRAAVVTIFFCDQIGAPPERLAQMQASPIWPMVLEISSTLPRESREVNTYRSWQERLAKWKTPLTMMLGAESSLYLKEGANFVSRSIPSCRLVTLEGQGHSAMLEAPELFLAKVFEIADSETGRQTA